MVNSRDVAVAGNAEEEEEVTGIKIWMYTHFFEWRSHALVQKKYASHKKKKKKMLQSQTNPQTRIARTKQHQNTTMKTTQ